MPEIVALQGEENPNANPGKWALPPHPQPLSPWGEGSGAQNIAHRPWLVLRFELGV